MFAEGAARVVADHLIARIRGGDEPAGYDGVATCYVEFGDDLVGRVKVDFFSGPSPTGVFSEPSTTITAEKAEFGASRRRALVRRLTRRRRFRPRGLVSARGLARPARAKGGSQ